MKVIFKKDKYIVGITDEGELFESYATTYSKRILGASALYIKKLQAEIEQLKQQGVKNED